MTLLDKLTPRQKRFVELCMLTHKYRTITDAYIAVYRPIGSRRTSTASASRIYNKPAVKAYRARLIEIDAVRALEIREAEHDAYIRRLRGY